MKEFKDYKLEQTENIGDTEKESDLAENTLPLFKDYANKELSISYLNESENAEVDRWVAICENEHSGQMDEGFIGKLVGGAAGFIIGPTIGKVIAKALGIEKGILYDMFTSRLVSTALGAAIAEAFGKK